MPKKQGVEMPGTLERSPKKAQRTYAKTLESAEAEYGQGERASRTAWSSVKHSFEKVGNHWETKDHKGPSDSQSALSGKAAREGRGRSTGGVDAIGHTKKELYERAKKLGVTGRSSMNKEDLASAIAKKQD